jgi:2,3-bisphosphoglycerate-independent phosphoglycerate mutase
MKYVIILPDGAADDPLPELGGRTPLQAARKPHMDWVAQHGRLGRVVTVPGGFTPGTDVGTMSLFGYDPHRSYTGRAPIEAAAKGLSVAPDELIFRCNFVTIRDGRMRDFTADHIHQDEADRLIADLNRLAGNGTPGSGARSGGTSGNVTPAAAAPELAGCVFHAGVGYRNLLVAAGAAAYQLKSTPPHDIPNQPVAEHLPRGTGQERVHGIMARAQTLLRDHAVNAERRTAGREPVTDIWLWGQGRPAPLESFQHRFGVRAGVITGVDIIRGLARLAGMALIDVPGVTGYFDTNYVNKGRYALHALDGYDLVIVHIEASDEAAHQGNAKEKIAALERTDEHIVGPLLAELQRRGDWRMLIAPDHVTSTATTQHAATPPPFCFAGSDVPTVERRTFSEAEAQAGGWLIERGHELIQTFFGRGG